MVNSTFGKNHCRHLNICWVFMSLVSVNTVSLIGQDPAPKVILGKVVDEATSKPIAKFRVLPASSYGSGDALEPVMQPHLLKECVDGEFEWPTERMYDKLQFRIEADGYLPAFSDWIEKSKAPEVIEIALIADPGIDGRLVDTQGKPISNATIAIGRPNSEVVLEKGTIRHDGEPLPDSLVDRWRIPIMVHSDAEGKFHLPPESKTNYPVVLVHESGCLVMSLAKFQRELDNSLDRSITLRPWGGIKGRVYWGDHPGVDTEIDSIFLPDEFGYPGLVAQYESTRTAKDGSFHWTKLMPGRVQTSIVVTLANGDGNKTRQNLQLVHLDVKNGEVAHVSFGGRYKKVTGQVLGVSIEKRVQVSLNLDKPKIWIRNLGLFVEDTQQTSTKVELEIDGSFEFSKIVPGNYTLSVVTDSQELLKKLVVIPDDDETEEVDLGEIVYHP